MCQNKCEVTPMMLENYIRINKLEWKDSSYADIF